MIKNSLSSFQPFRFYQTIIMDTYKPISIDTRNINLCDELMDLVETMAENVHEVWSSTRIGEGWTYGP